MVKIKLGDISFITKLAGFEHTKYIQGNNTHEKISEDDVPLFIGKTVQNGKIDKNFDWYIPKELSNQLERSKLNKKCLVLPYVGSVGDLAIFDASYDAHLGSNIAKIELAENCGYSEEFIYYFLKSDYGQKILLRDIQGAIQKNITMKAIREVSLPDISIQEQNNIVSILKSLDDKIQTNNQINQELEAMAKTLYDYWFVQFDFPDQNGKPYKSSGGKMVYNPELKREIPDGWGVTKLNEVVDLISGYPFSSNDYVTSGKYKLYTIKNVQDGYTVDKVDNYLDFLPSNMSHECQLRRGDLIMSLTGNVGRVGMVYEDDVLLNQRVLKLNPINKTHKSFIYSFFRSDVTKAHLENMSTGTSQKNLSPIDIGNMMIPFPSESLLSKFLDNLNMLENNLVENQQLTKLRDWLLPMLMNGQVKVK